MSWPSKIRDVAIMGAVVTVGLAAGVVLTACSARGRKEASPVPSNAGPPDATAADAAVDRPDAVATMVADAAIGLPDARRVRREQPLPRNYVE